MRQHLSTGDDLSKNELFDLLSSSRRRYVLHHLGEIDGEITLGDLTEAVAAWENDKPAEEITSDERKRVYVSLYQTHVPKLEDAGLITVGADGDEIELAEGIASEVPTIGWQESTSSWAQYYLAVAVGSSVFVLVTSFDVLVFGAVPDLVTDMVVVLSLGTLALVHYYTARQQRRQIPDDLVADN